MTPRWYYIFDNGWAYFQQLPTCSNPKPTDVEGKWINEGIANEINQEWKFDPSLTPIGNCTWGCEEGYERKNDSCVKVEPSFPISTCEDLNNVRLDLTKNYHLTNDIDCKDFGDFEPLPRYGGRLTSDVKVAVFDGQNHTISNITIRKPYKEGDPYSNSNLIASLFIGIGNLGMTSSYMSVHNPSIVKNLKLKNVTLATPPGVSIDGFNYNYFRAAPLTIDLSYGRTDEENSSIDNVIIENVHYDINLTETASISSNPGKEIILAGVTINNNQHTTINNSKVIGTITYNFYGNNTKPLFVSFGGITRDNAGTIINSTFELNNDINFDENSRIGGIAERTSSFYKIDNSINKTNLSGGIVGGIAATSSGRGQILSSKNYGNINASKLGGGLVGHNSGSIINSYSRANVLGKTAGGLTYSNSDSGYIQNSFSASYIDATSKGGLVQNTDYAFQVNNSYWDICRTESNTSAAGTGKNSDCSEMDVFFPKTELDGNYDVPMQNNENPENNWDFTNIWKKVPNWYPKLIWE